MQTPLMSEQCTCHLKHLNYSSNKDCVLTRSDKQPGCAAENTTFVSNAPVTELLKYKNKKLLVVLSHNENIPLSFAYVF